MCAFVSSAVLECHPCFSYLGDFFFFFFFLYLQQSIRRLCLNNCTTMPLRAVFTDMDGTLLNPQHEISDYTANVLKRLKEQGVFFVVATGRTYSEVIQTIHHCKLEPDFIITSNGGRIHDSRFNVLREHNITAHLTRQLLTIHRRKHTETGVVEPKTFITNVYRHTEWLTDKDVPEISGGIHKNIPCTVLGEAL